MAASELDGYRPVIGRELSDHDREQIDKLFGNWLAIPDTFKSALADYVAQNSLIPVSQLRGFTQLVAQQDEIFTPESTTSTSYADLTTAGPQLTGLERGVYIIQYGCECGATPIPASADSAIMSPSINGATPDETARVVFQSLFSTAQLSANVARALRVELSENDNSIKLQYRCINGNGVSFADRWLTALRIGNL
jgi:hypothetical protein